MLDTSSDTATVKFVRVAALSTLVGVSLLAPVGTAACSPGPDPTIEALGPKQVVVVGTIGERVPNGRLFHVERWYNGGVPITPIVIAFKEGAPVGDCSYIVTTGTRLIIAPEMEPGGRLSANLGTIQGDPNTADGRKWVDEAVRLFGAGVVPGAAARTAPVDAAPPIAPLIAGLVVLASVAAAGVWSWRRRSAATGEAS
jgi:hypothetical protein